MRTPEVGSRELGGKIHEPVRTVQVLAIYCSTGVLKALVSTSSSRIEYIVVGRVHMCVLTMASGFNDLPHLPMLPTIAVTPTIPLTQWEIMVKYME